MYIAENEFSEWLNESEAIKNAVLQCYKETISDMSDNLLTDPRSCNNHHIINPDFSQNPKYMMASIQISKIINSFYLLYTCFLNIGETVLGRS